MRPPCNLRLFPFLYCITRRLKNYNKHRRVGEILNIMIVVVKQSNLLMWSPPLGKLSVPERPTNLDNCRARICSCACSRCGWGLFGHFFSRLSFLSPSLEDGPIKTEMLSQRAVKPKTTNQPTPLLGNHVS